MGILKHTSILLLALAFVGCTETFNPVLDAEPVLCVNSLITAGEPVSVDVSRTWTYNDSDGRDNHGVDDAVVSIYANGELRNEDYIPREGDEIRIVAESKKYGKAEATVIVPKAVQLTLADFIPEILSKDTWDDTPLSMRGLMTFNMRISLKIEDDKDRDNYFRLYVAEKYQDGANTSHLFPDFSAGELDINAEPIFREHVGVFESVMGEDSDASMVFSDRQFAGKSYFLRLAFNKAGFYLASPEYDESLYDFGISFTLATVSSSYYNYVLYLWQRDSGIIGDLGDFGFAESLAAYSNVSTGAGIVAARSLSTYTLSLKDFLKSQF